MSEEEEVVEEENQQDIRKRKLNKRRTELTEKYMYFDVYIMYSIDGCE